MNGEAELEKWRAKLRNEWRIADDCGDPMPTRLKVYEMVVLEMKFRSSIELSMTVADLAARWIDTRNPSLIDHAVGLCTNAGIEPPSALWAEVANVARCRLQNDVGAGTPGRLEISSATNRALLLIANLVHSGATLAEASSKAAAWYSITFKKLKPVKASTLDKYYLETWRLPGRDGRVLETELFEKWDSSKSPEAKADWHLIRTMLPEAEFELVGARR
jgi:hypothetical protein